jgi:hypothetical protein
VVIAAFLVISCNGSLPFASLFVQDETSVADKQGFTAKVNPGDLLSAPGEGILNLAYNDIEVVYTDSTGQERTVYVDKSDMIYAESQQIVTTSEGLTAKVNPDDLLSARREGVLNLAYDDIEVTYTDSTGQERTAYVGKSDIIYTEREQIVTTSEGLTAKVNPGDLLSSRGEGVLNLAYNDIEVTYTDSTGQERTAYVDKSDMIYTEREQTVATVGSLTAKVRPNDLLSFRGEGILNLAYDDIEVTYTDSTGQERTAYVDKSDMIYAEREQIVTTPKGLTAKVNPDDLLSPRKESILNFPYNDIEVVYTDSTGQERTAYVDKSDMIYAEREQIVTTSKGLTAEVNPEDLLSYRGEGVLNLAYDDIEVVYTGSTGQERTAYVDKSDIIYTESQQIVTTPGSLTTTALAEEQLSLTE